MKRFGRIQSRRAADRLVRGILTGIVCEDRIELIRDASIIAACGTTGSILSISRLVVAVMLSTAVAEGGQPAHGRCRAADPAACTATASGTEHGHPILQRRRCLLADATAASLALGIVVVVATFRSIRRRTAQDGRGSGHGRISTSAAIRELISTEQRRLGPLLIRQRWADAQNAAELSLAGLRDESLVMRSMGSVWGFVRRFATATLAAAARGRWAVPAAASAAAGDRAAAAAAAALGRHGGGQEVCKLDCR